MTTKKPSILIFVKNAVKGRVKTRLAATVGPDRALQIYLALLKHTRQIVLPLAADRHLFYSDQIDRADDWPETHFHKHLQQGNGLGVRMQQAFEKIFQINEPVLIIGSDCASLTTDIIQTAFERLEEYPFVIGPATDGGYYLLGMQRMSPSLFEGIAWSTDKVLEQSLAAIQALNQAYFLLPELSDIDYEEDWEQFGWKLE